jgi:thiol-disulfide isomerase/thioredoxin
MPGGEKILESSLGALLFPSAVLADYDWTVKSLDGQDFKMADAKRKVVFPNFWATWCPPCVTEMPSIQRLHDYLFKPVRIIHEFLYSISGYSFHPLQVEVRAELRENLNPSFRNIVSLYGLFFH